MEEDSRYVEMMDKIAQARELPRRAMALVLAGGRGTRLKSLTDQCAKPAVHFAGKFRIIDFVLSNCLNSNISRIGIITQYKAHLLLRHLQRGWSFLKGDNHEFIDLLPAQQRISEEYWYRGTADAIYQNQDIVREYGPEFVVILASDHVYKMDYARLLLDHVKLGAQCTVACIEVPVEDAAGFGIMQVEANRKITAFYEKPSNPPTMPNSPGMCLASMGIYVFNADYLYQCLAEDAASQSSTHDFGNDIVPKIVGRGEAYAHPFSMSCVSRRADAKPYWRDVGTIDSYWAANLDLISNNPDLDIYDQYWPIYTYQEQLPPAKFIKSTTESTYRSHHVDNTMLSGGCIVVESDISDSLLFSRVKIDVGSIVRASVLLPGVRLGKGCRLSRCVVSSDCVLPDGTVIGEDRVRDNRFFHVTERGVTLISQAMINKMVEEERF